MFPFKFEFRINNELLTKRMERRVKKEVKEVLQQVAILHKIKHIPRHFTRKAYTLYPAAYAGRKKKVGRPLVESGNLEKIVTSQQPVVGGTSRQAWLKIKFGRPAQYRGSRLRKKIISRIKALRAVGVKESWKEAESAVLKKAGYGRELRDYIRKRIKPIRGSEQQHLQSFAKKELVKRIKANTGRTVEVVRVF